MNEATINPAKTGNSRVYYIDGRAKPANAPVYESNWKIGGLSQDTGDVTKIEVPHPSRFGAFIEVGQIRGATSRVTSEIMSRYSIQELSPLKLLSRAGCSFDIHVNFGICEDPSSGIDAFTKKIIVEDVVITNYSTDELGALASDENAVINETASWSAATAYEVVPLSLAERGKTVVTNEVVDLISCDVDSCGDCAEPSDGASKFYGVTLRAGGSAGTSPDLVFTKNKGQTWFAHDIDSLTSSQDATGVACLGDYIVVTSADALSYSYTDKATVEGGGDPAWSEIFTGFVAGGGPRAIRVANSLAYIVGNGGYVYTLRNIGGAVTAIDAGVATADNLLAVAALSDKFAVAVGNNGAVLKITDGAVATAVTRPVGATVNLNCVAVKSTRDWIVGTSNERVFYTDDGGATWNQITGFPLSATTTSIEAISFATDSVGFMSTIVASRAVMLQTFDGGYTWFVMPQGAGSIPAADRINAIATAWGEPNLFVGAGLADDATDGFIIVGA
jgi:photosystem II stability/assembly factor-like uncharacterized protein